MAPDKHIASAGVEDYRSGVSRRPILFSIVTVVSQSPLWEPLRDDPRFQAILEGMGLAD